MVPSSLAAASDDPLGLNAIALIGATCPLTVIGVASADGPISTTSFDRPATRQDYLPSMNYLPASH
jgi:hypothetical protein